MHLKSESAGIRLVAPLVAGGLVALSFAGGGYGAQPRAIAGIAIWALVAVGLLSGLLPLAASARTGVLLVALFAVLTLLTGLSLAWASDAGAAFQSTDLALLYLGITTLVALTATSTTAGAWMHGLGLGLLAIAGVALASRFAPGALPDPVATALPAARSRLSYPIGYWNALGLAMAMAIVILAWLASEGETRRGRVAALAALPLPALALYLTSSRGAVLALAAGLGLLVLFERRRLALALNLALGAAGALAVIAVAATRAAFTDGATGSVARGQGHAVLASLLAACAGVAAIRLAADGRLRRAAGWRAPRRAAIGGLAILLAVAIAVVVTADPVARWDAFKTAPASPGASGTGVVSAHLLSGGGSGRYQFWSTAWDAFSAHPLAGLGAGGYEAWWTREGSLPYFVRNAHSLGLETLAELGALGGLLLVGLVAVVTTTAIRRRRAEEKHDLLAVAVAVAGCGAVAAATDWMWQVPAVLAPAVVAAVVATALPTSSAPQRRARWLAPALAVAVIGVLAGAIVLTTEVRLAQSRDAVRAGDLVAAAGAAADAAAVQPWAAAPRLQLALVEERRGDLPEALRALSQALARAPDDWRAWLVATRLRLAAGDPAGARRAAVRLRCIYPRASFLPHERLHSRASMSWQEIFCDEGSD